jgi:cyclomaltodextrinase
MEDFIFGTLITDELKLIHHRSRNTGLQHNYSIQPIRPEPNKPVTVSVLVGPDIDAEQMVCYYTVDGSYPSGSMGKATNGKVAKLALSHVEWNTMTWGYSEIWRGDIPGQPAGTLVRYRIGAWVEGGEEFFADWPDPKYRQETATHAHFTKQPFPKIDPTKFRHGGTFAYHLNAGELPQWAREAVIYHIFADRFHPGEGREWLQTSNLRELVGGTLWGVRDKLDYIQELGATAIWLSPTWPSTSYHGYDVTDYYSTADHLGGDAAMHALVEEAHKRGIKILLDLVCNHTSNEHPDFVDALNNPNSKFRDRFIFDDTEIGYRTFFGVASMPQVNLQNAEARAWMIDIAKFWLREFDVDGFRLDHANGPAPGFWSEFQSACKEIKPDCLNIGEVVEPPEDFLHYSWRLDGLLDFSFNDAVRRAYGYGSYDEKQFRRFVSRHKEFFKDSGLLMPTFIDNHDLDRFLYIAGGDKEKLRKAAATQFEMAGPPTIYYGTEIGMSQTVSAHETDGLVPSREPMVWDAKQDKELLAFYKDLIKKRNQAKPWRR